MIKRKTALYYTFFASIIMLALAVMPHHHHEGGVCIVGSACHAEHNTNDHNTDSHHNDNDASDSDNLCILDQDIILPTNNSEQNIVAVNTIDSKYDFDGFQTIPSNFKYLLQYPPDISRIPFKINNSLYSHLIRKGFGLRGPPIA